MTHQTPLDDFEFQPAAEIRKEPPPPRRRKSEPAEKTGTRWHIWSGLALFFFAFVLLAFFHLSESKRMRLENRALISQRDTALAQVNQLKDELDSIETKLKDLNRQFNNSRQGKEKLLQTIEDLRNGLDQRDRTITSLEKKNRAAGKKLEQAENTIEQRDKTIHEQKLQIDRMTEQNTELQAKIEPLLDESDKLKRQLNTVQSDLSREGEASRQIISELLEKDRAISDLKNQVTALKNDRDHWKKTAEREKRVEEGDLVPLDEHVTPAKPLVHPPVLVERKGLFGKVSGFVMVNARIDEVGRVRNATYLQHKLEGDVEAETIINRAMQTVMQWKFVPALYDDQTKVQVWQAVLVPVRNQ